MTANKMQGDVTIRDEEFDDKSYEELIQLTLKDFEKIENDKKRRIIILAKKLEKLGTPKDMISQKISRDLQEMVNSSYVRECLEGAYKDRKQVREHITRQSRESTRANDSKKVLVGVTNEGKQETVKELPSLIEQPNNERDSHTPKDEAITIESLQEKLRQVEQERDNFAGKLAKKSPDFEELYDEIKQLREIETERAKNSSDFSGAASLPATNELQQKIKSLEKRIKEQDALLVKTRFQGDLELKDEIIPVIVTIDRISGKAKVTADTSKMNSRP